MKDLFELKEGYEEWDAILIHKKHPYGPFKRGQWEVDLIGSIGAIRKIIQERGENDCRVKEHYSIYPTAIDVTASSVRYDLLPVIGII